MIDEQMETRALVMCLEPGPTKIKNKSQVFLTPECSLVTAVVEIWRNKAEYKVGGEITQQLRDYHLKLYCIFSILFYIKCILLIGLKLSKFCMLVLLCHWSLFRNILNYIFFIKIITISCYFSGSHLLLL